MRHFISLCIGIDSLVFVMDYERYDCSKLEILTLVIAWNRTFASPLLFWSSQHKNITINKEVPPKCTGRIVDKIRQVEKEAQAWSQMSWLRAGASYALKMNEWRRRPLKVVWACAYWAIIRNISVKEQGQRKRHTFCPPYVFMDGKAITSYPFLCLASNTVLHYKTCCAHIY